MKLLKYIALLAVLMTYYISNGQSPLVLNALDVVSTSSADYEDFNFNRAFFNQFTSLLDLTIQLDYPSGYSDAERTVYENNALCYQSANAAPLVCLTDWTRPLPNTSKAVLNSTWNQYITNSLFGRNFNTTTKKAERWPMIRLQKSILGGRTNDIILSISLQSKISYQIAPAEALMAFTFVAANPDDRLGMSWYFQNNETILGNIQTPIYIDDEPIDTVKYVFPIVFNSVNNFTLYFILSNPSGIGADYVELHEFNFFAETPIKIPDDADEEVFGIKFTAVEWWDILGHFGNFIWWIVAKSPIAPIFIWVNDYILDWIGQTLNIFKEVFNL